MGYYILVTEDDHTLPDGCVMLASAVSNVYIAILSCDHFTVDCFISSFCYGLWSRSNRCDGMNACVCVSMSDHTHSPGEDIPQQHIQFT